MNQEGKVYEWAKEITKSCPGVESLSRTEFKHMYNGSMKTVLDCMAKHLRSAEDAETARNRARMVQMRELLEKKKALDLRIKKLQSEKEANLKILHSLETKNIAQDSCLEETQNQVSLFQAYAKQSNTQCKSIQALQQTAQAHGHKMSPTLFNSEKSAHPSFIFNSTMNKLESVLKVETRKLMTNLSQPSDIAVAATCATQMISKYSGDERWKTVLDLQSELKLEAAKMSEDVNLKKDAEILSKELEGEESEISVIRPLQRHLDSLILEHATLMLTRLHRDREISALELQLKDLCNLDSEAEKEVQDAIQSAQVAKLQSNLAKLISQNRQASHSQSEIARKILKVKNFNQETEIRKNKIVQLMTAMQSASRLVVHLKNENENRAQEINAEFDSFNQLADIVQSQLTSLTQQPLNTFFEKQPSSASGSSSGNEMSPEYPSILEIVYEIEKTKNQLQFLQNLQHISADSHGNKSAVEKTWQSIQKEKQVLQQKAVELRQHLDLEQEFQNEKLADLLKIWKEDPVFTALLQDKITTVGGMTLAEWVEYAEHSSEQNQ